MTQQASYVFVEDGTAFAVVFEGDAVICAVEAYDPDPALLQQYIFEGQSESDPDVVEDINQRLSFGGAVEIGEQFTVGV